MAVFKSKVDRWLAIVVIAGSLLPFIILGALNLAGLLQWREVWFLIPIFLLSSAFVLSLFLSTYYVLGPDQLLVRSGPFRWRIPLSSITSVTPTRNPLSSPALSLDRLEIRYGKGEILLVSPRERELFLRELAARSPQAVVASSAAPHELRR